jgi:cephalosporin-C deacetylase-like acetyl esterase
MKSKADDTVCAVASVHTISGSDDHAVPGNNPIARANFKMLCPGLSGTHAMRVYGRVSSSKIGGVAPRGVLETHESLLCRKVVCTVVEAVSVVVVSVLYVFV